MLKKFYMNEKLFRKFVATTLGLSRSPLVFRLVIFPVKLFDCLIILTV